MLEEKGPCAFTNSGSLQGIAALMAMSILERDKDVGSFAWGSAQHLHRAVAAMRLAFADALAYNADPDVVPVNLSECLSNDGQ